MDYDLSCTTPLDALNFLAGIQKELKTNNTLSIYPIYE